MIGVSKLPASANATAIQPRLPGIFGWKTSAWESWPEVIPPSGGFVAGALALLVLAMAVVGYLLARHWSARADFSLMGLALFAIPAVALAFAEPRAAFSFIWPVLIGSLVWIMALVGARRLANWSVDIAFALAALPLCVFFVPFLPGIVMSDGMKSLNILAGIEVALLSAVLPAVDGLLVRRPARK